MSRSPPPPLVAKEGAGSRFQLQPSARVTTTKNLTKRKEKEKPEIPPPSFQATQGFMGKGEREDKRPSSSSSLPVSAEQGPAYPFPLPSSSPFLSPSILHPFTRRGTHCSVSREKGF